MAKRKRAAPRRIRFNKGTIAGIAPPKRGRVYVFDTQTPALAVCVTEKGVRTFYRYGRIHGKPQRVRIGRYPQVTVAAAREQAVRLNYQVTIGKDPHAESQQRRGGETLEQVYERYVAAPTRRKGVKAVRTVANYQHQWGRYLDQWADHKLSAITPRQVDALHAEIGEGGEQTRHYMANRVLALLSAIFEFAIRDGVQVVNPCRSVERFPEASRERAIQASEMPDFLGAVRAQPDRRMQDFFLLLLFTGARRGNVEAAQWDEFDLKRRVWTPIVKGGKAHTIPLVNEAEAILKRRQRTADGEPWVFPAQGKTGHVVEPRPQWRRILATAGLVDVRIHDLRRTLASWMADTGSTETVIGAVLGHSPQSVTGVYARSSEGAQRSAMQTAVRAMLETENLDG